MPSIAASLHPDEFSFGPGCSCVSGVESSAPAHAAEISAFFDCFLARGCVSSAFSVESGFSSDGCPTFSQISVATGTPSEYDGRGRLALGEELEHARHTKMRPSNRRAQIAAPPPLDFFGSGGARTCGGGSFQDAVCGSARAAGTSEYSMPQLPARTYGSPARSKPSHEISNSPSVAGTSSGSRHSQRTRRPSHPAFLHQMRDTGIAGPPVCVICGAGSVRNPVPSLPDSNSRVGMSRSRMRRSFAAASAHSTTKSPQ